MLDIKFIRENVDLVKRGVANKNTDIDIDRLISMDAKRRALLAEVETIKSYRNDVSKKIGLLKKEKKPCDDIFEEMKNVGDKIKVLDDEVRNITMEIDNLLVWIPNIPHESAPVGKDSTENTFVREWGQKRQFDFDPKAHYDIGEALGILDFERATKLSGSGFILFKGMGALLERAMINFMIDIHTARHGYLEVSPPFMVKSACMFGTGQLPKMEPDMYKLPEDDLFLIPTAEVPVTNIHRGEILEESELPKRFVAYTPCYRREAGSYGKETRGMVRVHQFDKVELVKLVKEGDAYPELEKLLVDAETILQILKLPYRIIELCSGDMSFAAAKCYDIEAWAPGQNGYLEVSSCSTFEDFQARRMGLRYREAESRKVKFVHTMNGSGLALPRVVVAILENYQQADGTVVIPEALRPYMGNKERIDLR
ncbi:MAG: serine--tRNA ligase [Candidatus Auribacterota bacterium]|jgi:seryl-tRNA synthetase|nr:serine--tRNA ligase [Candidatus Auribacterota bacterium]